LFDRQRLCVNRANVFGAPVEPSRIARKWHRFTPKVRSWCKRRSRAFSIERQRRRRIDGRPGTARISDASVDRRNSDFYRAASA
jgi:hypothetical protein